MATGNANFNATQSAQLNTWLSKNFADAVFEGLPLTAWLKKKNRIIAADPGPLLVEPVMYEQNGTFKRMGNYYDELDLRPVEGLTSAQFPWKWYTITIVMAELEREMNSGPNRIIELWRTKVMQAEKSAQTQFDADLYQDGTQSANAITGLDAIIASTGTYGNISRTGNGYWQAYVDTNGGAFTTDKIRHAVNKVTRQGIEKPDLILTTLDLYEAYIAQVEPAYRTTSVEMADLGFQNAAYAGIPIVWSDSVPSGTMYIIN